MADRGDGRSANAADRFAEGGHIPGKQQMGVHPEKLAGQDSKAAGGDKSRGLAGLDPKRLVGNKGSGGRELVETPIDGSQVLVGVFGDPEGADRALSALQAAGYDPREVNVLSKRRDEAQDLADSLNPSFGESSALGEPEAERMQGETTAGQTTKANLGTAVGLLAGAAAGVAIGLAALAMPGIGSLLASFGAPAAMLAGGVVGAGVGAWGGSLAGVSIPDEDTSYFTGDLAKGAYLVAVRTNQLDETIDLLRDAGARNFQEAQGSH